MFCGHYRHLEILATHRRITVIGKQSSVKLCKTAKRQNLGKIKTECFWNNDSAGFE